MLSRLTHPHIVRAYDVLTEPAPVVVLETLTGATLSALIDERRWRQLPVRQVALLGVQLASALRYLHANKVVHCDLKPGNVIAEAGRAKVIDLSLARRPGRGRQGAGTRDYMAPEQARGEWISTATDVWGLGATLYDAATSYQPFDSQAEIEAGRDRYPQARMAAPPVRSHRRRLPDAFADLIDACLRADPAARPTLEEVTAVLAPLTRVDRRAPASNARRIGWVRPGSVVVRQERQL